MPDIYRTLCSTVQNHSVITPLNYAVTKSTEREIIFYKAGTLSTSNIEWLTSESSRFKGTRYETIRCPTISLDNLISAHGVPDLIKIDVEGGEYDVISSLSTKVDNLCFEWASETNNLTEKCLEYLQSLGFKEFYVQNRDCYTFRPKPDAYYDIENAMSIMLSSKEKIDWGMVWCK